MQTTITIEPGFGYFTRYCKICGEAFDTAENRNLLSVDEGDDRPSFNIACDTCTTNGVDKVRANLLGHAQQLQNFAAHLEAMAAGEIIMPSPDDAKAQIEEIIREREEEWREYEEQQRKSAADPVEPSTDPNLPF